MAASAYCTAADLYRSGLPRGGLPNPGRLVAAVEVSGNLLTLDGHGFEADDELVFRAESGGSLPAPLVAGTTYYAKPSTDSTFQVAATAGGAAVDLTTSGSNVVVVAELPIASAIKWASAMIDSFLPAHLVPMTAPINELVVATAADLAVARLLAYTGQSSTQIADKLASAQKLLERWAKNFPIRGVNAPASAQLAVAGSSTSSDPRGWDPSHGGLP